MRYTIEGHPYTLTKQVRDSAEIRRSFDALATQVFDLSFEAWNARGYWTDRYVPYALLDDGRVVANASVNHMDFRWRGGRRRYIQLGTVMTDPAYRGRGLSRLLMDAIMADWRGQCDGMYLYANDSVLDFYPRFGFMPAREYGAKATYAGGPLASRRLDMDDPADVAVLRDAYARGNPFSALDMLDNMGLVMFHASSWLRDCVYHVPGAGAVVIAAEDDQGLLCYDVYGGEGSSLERILGSLIRGAAREVRFGFARKDAAGGTLLPAEEEDSTLFVLAEGENPFAEHRTMFPLLSHA